MEYIILEIAILRTDFEKATWFMDFFPFKGFT